MSASFSHKQSPRLPSLSLSVNSSLLETIRSTDLDLTRLALCRRKHLEFHLLRPVARIGNFQAPVGPAALIVFLGPKRCLIVSQSRSEQNAQLVFDFGEPDMFFDHLKS